MSTRTADWLALFICALCCIAGAIGLHHSIDRQFNAAMQAHGCQPVEHNGQRAYMCDGYLYTKERP